MKTAVLLIALAAAAFQATAADPVGEWTAGKAISLTLYPLGPVHLGITVLKVTEPGLFIKATGNWKVITEGKWKGYINIDTAIGIYERNGKDVTPPYNPITSCWTCTTGTCAT